MANTPARYRGRLRPRTKTPDADGFITSSRFCKAVAREIVKRIADGESWLSMCNTGRLPCHSTLYVWRDRHPDFAAALRWAREAAADLKADKALAVAEKATAATVTSDRLHFQALMQRAAFDAPGQWNDKARPPETPQKVEVVFRVRHFERVVGPDGKAQVKEIKPRGRS